MSTDETREALTAMVREGKAAGMYEAGRRDAPSVSAEQVEAAWAAWFPSTSGPWSTNFRWRLYKALNDLGMTVTGGAAT